ncbi:hypothetical protein EYZ11_004809 [Aspergillus tanneri]|uniref:DUF6924 domain-containing protein n=1 Tax=Aspergillus tanneri TaxID=1220188 RepID=A0A4S3JQG5_9EURO|nr:uncharacterized protein ATNIH1004_006346 [Aspergillus tanneri]KAA8647652.1 hypothetical protein ATNIH1004_006346 [Aspergillus tanneri]THC95731.1 hypothetical protein EYZ11_004809 [Aspergillus tanneri]
MPFTIILSAENASVKKVNKAILLMEDYEYGCDHSWALLRDASLPKNPTIVPASIPPLDVNEDTFTSANNSFCGKTADQIHDFIQENESKLSKMDLTVSHWVIIDEKGLEAETCLVCENTEDDEDVEEPYRMARLPWSQAWAMFSNLDIANMDFDEWVDEEAMRDEDGAWKWVGPFSESEDGEIEKKIQLAIEKARREEIID